MGASLTHLSDPARVQRAIVLLERHLEAGARRLDVVSGVDAIVGVGRWTFLLEVKSSGTGASVDAAARALAEASKRHKSAIPLVVVPRMTSVGRRRCEALDLAWLDLAGNANIAARGLRISVQNQQETRPRGRPSSIFTPLRSRLVRHLLMFPDVALTQRELARQIEVSEAEVSRVVHRLQDDHVVVRQDDGTIRLVEAATLLADWREAYDFTRHTIVRGHVQARTGVQLTQNVSAWLAARQISHAATGLAGAWFWTHFAMFRISTLFVAEPLTTAQEKDLGFIHNESGANLWLVTPNERSVFTGATLREDVPCAHPLQVYLDLKAHPERSAEAAERLHQEFLAKAPHV